MYPIAQLLFFIIALGPSFMGITFQLQRSQGSVRWRCSGSSPNFPRTNGAFELNPTSAETNTTNTPPAPLLGHLLAFRKLVPLSRSFASLLLGCSRLSKRYVHFLAALYSNAQTNSVAAKPPPHRESSTGLQRRLLLRDHQGKPTLARLCSATDLLTVPRNRFL
jgi:hypothetical protein